ncbi:MAG TPA: hypothetical protein VFN88_14000 [Caulobacteraceae bacterium]|nr:hypothetical protein [Caulobacteraceae bacterium]
MSAERTEDSPHASLERVDQMTASTLKPATMVVGGLALAASGLFVVLTVAIDIYVASPAADAAAFRLGLAGACLLSGLGQIAVLVGAWVVWRGVATARRARR